MGTLSISAEALSKRYNREWIFRDLTQTFQQGKIYAITGPNGSGKSTLLQVLWGQMPPSSGKLIYRMDNLAVEADEIYPLVSIATPYMDLIDEFTLQEQVEFHFKTKSIKHNYTPKLVMEAMYLEHAHNKFISNFSSGMKQRLKLGLAFFTDTPALFLDEPGTNLDKQAMAWYQSQLKSLANNRLVFIASNQVEEYPEGAEIVNVMDYKPTTIKVP